MTEPKLKPCPFCGGEAIIVYQAKRKSVDGDYLTGTAIGCNNCNAEMFYINCDLAIEAWNKRVPQRTATMKVYDSFGGEVAE